MARMLPEDIQPDWFNLIRRLQSIVATQNKQTVGILYVEILIDKENRPDCWFIPEFKMIEPRSRAENLLRAYRGLPFVERNDNEQ